MAPPADMSTVAIPESVDAHLILDVPSDEAEILSDDHLGDNGEFGDGLAGYISPKVRDGVMDGRYTPEESSGVAQTVREIIEAVRKALSPKESGDDYSAERGVHYECMGC